MQASTAMNGRCLFVTREVPLPAHGGSRIRALNLLRALSQRWNLHVVAGQGGLEEAGELAALLGATVEVAEPGRRRRTLATVVSGLARGIPPGMARHYHPKLVSTVRRRLAHSPTDLAIIHSLHAAGVIEALGGVPLVLDFDNLEGQIWERYADLKRFPLRQLLRLEGRRLLRYQVRLSDQVLCAVCVSELEAAWLQKHAPRARVIVVPNSFESPPNLPDRNPDGGLLFVGDLNWFANADGLRWFIAGVWPKVRKAHPDRSFRIAGQPPKDGTRNIGLDQPGILYLGHLDRLEPAYAESAMVVIPLRVGGGTRLKILEAFARGVPVISTAIGAEGLAAVPGKHFLEADTPQEIVDAVDCLSRDPGLADSLRREAFSLVRDKYSVDAVARALDAIPLLTPPTAGAA